MRSFDRSGSSTVSHTFETAEKITPDLFNVAGMNLHVLLGYLQLTSN
jgi:hypothetical protein